VQGVVERLKHRGILSMAPDPTRLRLLTHNDVDDQDVDRLLQEAASL
jgi:hypothetical protein